MSFIEVPCDSCNCKKAEKSLEILEFARTIYLCDRCFEDLVREFCSEELAEDLLSEKENGHDFESKANI